MTKKISLTKVNKTLTDKFIDLQKIFLSRQPVFKKVKTDKKNKKGKIIYKRLKVYTYVKRRNNKGVYVQKKERKFKITGKKEFAVALGITQKQLNKNLQSGVSKKYPINKKKLDFYHNEVFDIPDQVNVLKEYHNDSFTLKNFYPVPKLRRLKKIREVYYFRCGIQLVCNNNINKNENYIIENIPIPTDMTHDWLNIKDGFLHIFDQIKKTLQKYPSLLKWRINYFDVSIIDTADRKMTKGKKTYKKYVPPNKKIFITDVWIEKKKRIDMNMFNLKNKYAR